MAKINPKIMKSVFTDDILDALPSNSNIKRGVANLIKNTDPNFIEKKKRSQNTPEYKHQRSKITRQYLEKNYDTWVESVKQGMNKESVVKTISDKATQRYKDPAFRKKASDIMKKVYEENPEIREKQSKSALGRKASNKTKKLMSEVRKGRKHKETTRTNMTRIYIGTNIETGKQIQCFGTHEIQKAGFSPSMVSECVNGKRNTVKGYTWKKIKSYEYHK